MQPITLYSHQRGPNPWKVALILGELGVPFETIYLEFPEAKVEPYIRLNPNGKLPAIKDPNRDIVLFEVCVSVISEESIAWLVSGNVSNSTESLPEWRHH